MKRSPLTILIAALLIVIFGAMLFIFQVRQSEVAVVTVFDRLAPDGVQTNPGPHWQWPWPIAKVYKLDQRLHSMEDNSDSCLLHDDKIVLLLTYTGWRISDPANFFKKFQDGSIVAAEDKLKEIVRSCKSAVAGNHNFSDFVSADPSQIKFTNIESEILATVRQKVTDDGYGIDVRFVQIKNIELPTSVSETVFARMKSERAKLASVIQSDATNRTLAIRGDANSHASTLLGEADARALEIRGQGELQIVEALQVMNGDPAFAKFLMSLDALAEIGKNQSTWIVNPDTRGMELLKYPTPAGATNRNAVTNQTDR
jgi:membrane protease subunit HflC